MQENDINKSSITQSALTDTNAFGISYESGDILIRPELGQVMAAEQTARLTPVNMKVLVTLLERAGEVVSRGDIYQQVWSNQIVSDDTLTRAISDIRAVFKSLAIEAKLIETIPKKGYRWLTSCDLLTESREPKPLSHASKQKDNSLNEKNRAITTELELSGRKQRLVPNWLKWSLWSIAAIVFFSSLVISTIWMVKGQFNDRYIKVAMMPVNLAGDEHSELAILLSETLQQRVLKTKDIRLLSSRMGYEQQRSMIPYLANEFSAKWVIEAEIRTTNGKTKITLDLVDAKSAVVLDSVNQSLKPNKKELESFVDIFIERLERLSNSN